MRRAYQYEVFTPRSIAHCMELLTLLSCELSMKTHFSLLGLELRWYGGSVDQNGQQDSDANGEGGEGGLVRMLFIVSFSLGITIGAFRADA